jgi:hypothetical protein
MPAVTPEREAPWAVGLRGARANLLPGLVLQGLALALVVAFYRHEPTHVWFLRLADFRTQQGLLYSVVATGFFGGLLPCVFLKLNPKTRDRYDLRQNTFLVAFWSYKGIEVDLWYRFLAASVGTETGPATVVIKMLLDQIAYCPLFAVPLTVVVYDWCEAHFSSRTIAGELNRPGWYSRRVLPMLVSNWGVWGPMVCIIYSLPTALQLPLFNLVLCFFTLLVAHISGEKHPA